MTSLAPTEAQRLASLESVVGRGLDTFMEVGEALREIRNSRLYRAEHETFEAYCRTRWGMSRAYAHRTIEAAEVSAALPIGDRPKTESQARELAPLRDKPQQMQSAVREASSNGRPTAKTIREAVRKRLAPSADQPKRREPEKKSPEGPILSDDERIAAAFDFIRQHRNLVNIEADPARWLRRLLGHRDAIDGLIARARTALGEGDLSPEELAEAEEFAARAGIEMRA